MRLRKIIFMTKIAPNEIYHVYNRGVEKRNIFLNDQDRFRFIHNLFEFNDEAPAANNYYKISKIQSYEVSLRKFKNKERQPRKLLVEIMAFCLMPNHFHLMVRQKSGNGITEFMRKLGTGYTNYFNKKYERVGALFQGKFKSVLISENSHFIHLPYYIHFNPLDLIAPEWRNREIKDLNKAIQFLENYRWSSYPDYIGKKNFPSVTQRDFLLKFFEGSTEYKKNSINWLKDLDLNELNKVVLE